MASESTFKMLAQMAGKKQSDVPQLIDIESNEVLSTPKLTPNHTMEQALADILGFNSAKNNTILD